MSSLDTTVRTRSDSAADRAPEERQIAAWRADTPGCAHRMHMNNAGAGLMPRSVIDAYADAALHEIIARAVHGPERATAS